MAKTLKLSLMHAAFSTSEAVMYTSCLGMLFSKQIIQVHMISFEKGSWPHCLCFNHREKKYFFFFQIQLDSFGHFKQPTKKYWLSTFFLFFCSFHSFFFIPFLSITFSFWIFSKIIVNKTTNFNFRMILVAIMKL